ncbi:hypothetical protein B0J17DRAFT_580052 [Rhizoctonia solani]|nr:hypothetical protein B0J17DRAFT_580052 [Rhizoctonia solani]
MDFPSEWGIGPVFDWYRQRHQVSPQSVAVDRLEIRIDNGKIPHRFIIARFRNTQVVRFDRRPLTPKAGTLSLETIGGLRTSRAADEYEELDQKGL